MPPLFSCACCSLVQKTYSSLTLTLWHIVWVDLMNLLENVFLFISTFQSWYRASVLSACAGSSVCCCSCFQFRVCFDCGRWWNVTVHSFEAITSNGLDTNVCSTFCVNWYLYVSLPWTWFLKTRYVLCYAVTYERLVFLSVPLLFHPMECCLHYISLNCQDFQEM